MAELYVLDTSAILTLTDQEGGANEVEDILNTARADECQIEVCSISLMELSYSRSWRIVVRTIKRSGVWWPRRATCRLMIFCASMAIRSWWL